MNFLTIKFCPFTQVLNSCFPRSIEQFKYLAVKFPVVLNPKCCILHFTAYSLNTTTLIYFVEMTSAISSVHNVSDVRKCASGLPNAPFCCICSYSYRDTASLHITFSHFY